MENNEKKSPTKKVTSITRKLQLHNFFIKLRLYITMDLFAFIITTALWLYMQESFITGDFKWNRERLFKLFDNDVKGLFYTVSAKNKVLVKINADMFLFRLLIIIVVILILQIFFGLVIGSIMEHSKIKKILSPINEMALKADELNKMTNFSDIDKYLQLKEEIDNFQPYSEKPLSFGDSDLAGIEAAINNLIIRMRESYEQQSRFVNDASHELRTPIAVIKGYSDMLKRWGSEDPQVLNEAIEAISNEIDHMNILVEQLLFLARGDSGRTTLNLEEVSVNKLTQEIYEESFMIDETHPYKFKSKDDEIQVSADYALLKQAVRILVDNAAKYTKEGDEILLSCGKTDKNEPYIQVQDSGIGMQESDVSHMFDRFYRADEARNYKGTGLGLSIAKWIVDRHNGHFEILSRTDLGTRIRIVLPTNLSEINQE